MNNSTGPSGIPRLRLRYGETEAEIIDIGWSSLQEQEDDDPWTIAFLQTDGVDPHARSTWDVEDPTDPDNDRYPPGDPAELPAAEFVRCAASHWQRVHPRMRRFTQTELELADFFAALGAVRKALDVLVEARDGDCGYVLEQHSSYR